jgi:hypothetical protein
MEFAQRRLLSQGRKGYEAIDEYHLKPLLSVTRVTLIIIEQ